jgi:hypothetical protein
MASTAVAATAADRSCVRHLEILDRCCPNNEEQAPLFRRRMLQKLRRTFDSLTGALRGDSSTEMGYRQRGAGMPPRY